MEVADPRGAGKGDLEANIAIVWIGRAASKSVDVEVVS